MARYSLGSSTQKALKRAGIVDDQISVDARKSRWDDFYGNGLAGLAFVPGLFSVASALMLVPKLFDITAPAFMTNSVVPLVSELVGHSVTAFVAANAWPIFIASWVACAALAAAAYYIERRSSINNNIMVNDYLQAYSAIVQVNLNNFIREIKSNPTKKLTPEETGRLVGLNDSTIDELPDLAAAQVWKAKRDLALAVLISNGVEPKTIISDASDESTKASDRDRLRTEYKLFESQCETHDVRTKAALDIQQAKNTGRAQGLAIGGALTTDSKTTQAVLILLALATIAFFTLGAAAIVAAPFFIAAAKLTTSPESYITDIRLPEQIPIPSRSEAISNARATIATHQPKP